MKIGIFGGTFNPPHMGHLSSLQDVKKKVGLEKVFVVPAFQNPLKNPLEGPTAEQRLQMTRLAVESWGSDFVVDDQEIKRGGKSFTIDTVKNFRNKIAADDLYLILGVDKLDEFEQWKDFSKILTEANLIVTSRPGFEFPQNKEELPRYIYDQVEEFDFNFIELKTGRNIQFVRVKDVPASGTEIRKWIRVGKSVEKFVPLSVESYIRKNGLYKHLGEKIGDYSHFTKFCADVLFSKKGISVKGFDLRKMTAPSEFTLVTSGTSTRHASALAENVMQAVKEEFNVHPQSLEGIDEGRWVVVDYGSLIIHIFYDFVRQEYSIENLWQGATDMGLTDPVGSNTSP
jgi:nicotinate-nucleotide adenylyltransferase